MKKWIWGIISLSLLFGMKAFAKEENPNFSVEPIINGGQLNSGGFFQLENIMGKEEKIAVRVSNNSSEEIKVKVEANRATTNRNGITSYLKSTQKDDSIEIDFEKIIQVESPILNIPPNSNELAEMIIKIPETSFSGQILGGLRFSILSDQTKKIVTNQFAYTIGVLILQNSENILPEIALNEVQVTQRNHQNYIEANIQNRAPVMVKKLIVEEASVYQENQPAPIYQASDDSMRMAPNSNFNFGISVGEGGVEPGNYRLKLIGSADGKIFYFDKIFKITIENVKGYPQQNTSVKKNSTKRNLIIMITILGLICIGFIGYFYQKKG